MMTLSIRLVIDVKANNVIQEITIIIDNNEKKTELQNCLKQNESEAWKE